MPDSAGRNWSITGNVLDLFGLKGCRVGSQSYMGSDINCLVVSHTPFLDSIGSRIKYGLANVSRQIKSNVAYIAISEIAAIQLYFENILKLSDIESCVEIDQSIEVKLLLGDQYYRVVIRENPSKTLAFYDSDNEDITPR